MGLMTLFSSRAGAAPARVGVVGDVHACDEALALLLEHLREVERVDAVWCVGDIVNGPGDPDRCAALLAAAGAVTVRGNHDRWLVEGVSVIPDAHRPEDFAPETRAYLDGLRPSAELELAGGVRALLCHGLGDNDMNRISADDYGYSLQANDELQALLRRGPRLIVKGHRHRHAIWRVGNLTLVDAGALLDRTAPCAVVVDAAERRWPRSGSPRPASLPIRPSRSSKRRPARAGGDDRVARGAPAGR
jgi:predicted phosphodiesterase